MKSFPNTLAARSGLLGVCLLAAMGLSSSCSKKPAASAPDVLAKVGAQEIRAEDLLKEAERRRQGHRPVPDKATLLQEMVDHEALVQRAHRAGLDEDPQIKREVSNLLIGKLLERELTPRLAAVQVNVEEIQAEYQRNLDKYKHPAKVRLALLHLPADAKMSEARRAELRQRMQEARGKAIATPAAGGFGPLAIEYSEDQASRYRGGDLGWMDAGNFSYRWPRSVLTSAYALDQGKVSDVIEAEGGFYLAMKTDARAGAIAPLTQVEAALRQSLMVKKRHDLEETFRNEVARLAAPIINAEALTAVELPLPPATVAHNTEPEPPALPGATPSSHGN